MKQSFLWFFLYIGFVYLTTNFIFQKEIPRLIIIYVWVFSTIFSITLRILLHTVMGIFYRNKYIEKRKIFVIQDSHDSPYNIEKSDFCDYVFLREKDEKMIHESIRKKEVDTIFSLS